MIEQILIWSHMITVITYSVMLHFSIRKITQLREQVKKLQESQRHCARCKQDFDRMKGFSDAMFGSDGVIGKKMEFNGLSELLNFKEIKKTLKQEELG